MRDTYQSTIVSSLLPSPLPNEFLQTRNINASGIVPHRFRTFREDVCLSVTVGEVQACQQRASLNLGEAVCEDV